MPLSVRTFHDLNVTIANNLHRFDRDNIDGIVGIPRSGSAPASLLATHLQKPVADLDHFCKTGMLHGRSGTEAVGVKRVILLDDTVNKGRAMRRASDMLRKARPNVAFLRVSVWGPYQLEEPSKEVDFWLEDLRGPRVFQWNMWKHIRLPRWFFDFDGVLCRDPDKEENDDGPRYENFLKTAAPMFLPTRPIGHIITSRNEKWRRETIGWLEKHRIQYSSLHMCPCETKRDRMSFMKGIEGGRGGWKSSVVKRLIEKGKLEYKPELFIESDPKQAAIIARQTGLLSFCTRSQTVF